MYLCVFGALLVLTLLTVGASYLHLPRFWALLIGLAIATVKGSLVAAYFMHLVSERTIIRSVLGLSLVGLFFLIMLPWMDLVNGFGTSTEAAAAEGSHTAGH